MVKKCCKPSRAIIKREKAPEIKFHHRNLLL
ncbi:unnamed protein product, partial [Rotaria sp. Silwood2]